MDPRAVLARGGDDVGQRVDRAGVDVARLRAHDRRAVAGRQRRGERVGAHRALAVDRDDLDRRAPEPEQPQRAPDRHVRLLAREHAQRRRAARGPAPPRPSPARASSACRAAASPVTFAICAPVVSPTPDVGRQPEQLEQPPARDLLDHRGGGRGDGVEARSGPTPTRASRRPAPRAARRRSRTRSSAGRARRRGPGAASRASASITSAPARRRRQRPAQRRAQLGVPGERPGVALADGRRGGPPRARRRGRAGRDRSWPQR